MRTALEWIRTRSSWLLALAVVAIIGAFFGRWTAPKCPEPEVREVKTAHGEGEQDIKATVATTTGPVEIHRVTRRRAPAPPPPVPVIPAARGDAPTLASAPLSPCDEEIDETIHIGAGGTKAEIDGHSKVKADTTDDLTIKPPPPTRPPDWRAGALVGVDLGALSLASPAGALVVGAHVERRVWGPMFLGAAALIRPARPLAPAIGASLSVEW